MNLYLIGGGSCSGKSTVAKSLCNSYGFRYLRLEDYTGTPITKISKQKYPITHHLRSLSDDDRILALARLSYRHELARQAELFFAFRNELEHTRNESIVVEGNGLLPDLVINNLSDWKGVWLIPTKQFQEKFYIKHSRMRQLVHKTDDPLEALQDWIKRDGRFNREVKRQAIHHNLPYLSITASRPLSYVQEWVEKHLQLR